MKKDHIRDYATEAFRFYARTASEQLKDYTAAETEDYRAVERILTVHSKEVPNEIIQAVYMKEPDKPLRRKDISERVVKAAREYYLSERSVYSILSKARRLFADERGLRR